ncbi:MAG: hypothetical protein LBG18_05615 [Mediterranea sp.]|jgi:hypothetical protein|nr:hypothetical protein [Mediterranea sp.]
MKRFASHYVYTSSSGFLRQYVVEINDDGYVAALYHLDEEIESIIWVPGVIRLMPHDCLSESRILTFDETADKTELPAGYDNMDSLKLIAVRLYPFDFSGMRATADTAIRVLSNSICF